MYRSILVPLDGSKLAESALPIAIHQARRHSAQLELITIDITVPTATVSVGLSVREIEPATDPDPTTRYLDGIARRISAVYPVPVKQTVRTGYARGAPALLEYVKESGTDLIVMATHGYGPLRRFWLGSFADAVARQSHLPTLLVRPKEVADVDLSSEPRFQRILIALDGSATAAKILEHARAFGDEGAEFILFNAVSPVLPIGLDVGYMGAPTDYALDTLSADESLVQARTEEAKAHLASLAQSFADRKLRAEIVISQSAFPASAILEYAEQNPIDLIAITTHGHGGAVRLVLGSVADKVVRGAEVPVLLYRPPAGG